MFLSALLLEKTKILDADFNQRAHGENEYNRKPLSVTAWQRESKKHLLISHLVGPIITKSSFFLLEFPPQIFSLYPAWVNVWKKMSFLKLLFSNLPPNYLQPEDVCNSLSLKGLSPGLGKAWREGTWGGLALLSHVRRIIKILIFCHLNSRILPWSSVSHWEKTQEFCFSRSNLVLI